MIPGLDETFLAMNGDILTTLDYKALIRHHREQRAALTIAMHQKDVRIDLGVLNTDECGDLIAYNEKPLYSFKVSMGVYVYEPHVLRYFPKGQYLDFPDLVKLLLLKGERISGYHSQDYWLDIGRREDYELAQLEYTSRAAEFQVA
jgi:NDP-sugar pyrophosphorylase family protein